MSEDGRVWGELDTGDSARMLPAGFRIPDHHLFFDIPQELKRNDLMRDLRPNYDGVIVSLVASAGDYECRFLMTQLPEHSPLRAALQDVGEQIRQLTEQA